MSPPTSVNSEKNLQHGVAGELGGESQKNKGDAGN
jgi:hypothetical protein